MHKRARRQPHLEGEEGPRSGSACGIHEETDFCTRRTERAGKRENQNPEQRVGGMRQPEDVIPVDSPRGNCYPEQGYQELPRIPTGIYSTVSGVSIHLLVHISDSLLQ